MFIPLKICHAVLTYFSTGHSNSLLTDHFSSQILPSSLKSAKNLPCGSYDRNKWKVIYCHLNLAGHLNVRGIEELWENKH